MKLIALTVRLVPESCSNSQVFESCKPSGATTWPRSESDSVDGERDPRPARTYSTLNKDSCYVCHPRKLTSLLSIQLLVTGERAQQRSIA